MGVIAEVFLPLALAFIMFSLGLGLTFDDFTSIAKRPKVFLVGVFSQLILLPIVAFILVSVWSLNPEIALGVMIIAAAPGGVTSNILTAFARGDVALSISLTAVTSLICVITIPLIVVFAHAQFIGGEVGDVSVAGTAVSVFLIVTVPVIIGLCARRYSEGFALHRRLGKPHLDGSFCNRPDRSDCPATRKYSSLFCRGRTCNPGAKCSYDDVGF